jgi:hypothetical protein
MFIPKQTLTNREVKIPGAFVKNPNAVLPKPKQFDPEIFWQQREAEQPQDYLTVPNQLPADGFSYPGSEPVYGFSDETPTEWDWNSRIKMVEFYG